MIFITWPKVAKDLVPFPVQVSQLLERAKGIKAQDHLSLDVTAGAGNGMMIFLMISAVRFLKSHRQPT